MTPSIPRVAVVASRFNEEVVKGLLEGAVQVLTDAGLDSSKVPVVRVPGALELALAVRELALTGRFDGIVALGCVIRGHTSHFEHVGREAVSGLHRTSLDTGVPVGIGVLTVDNEQQARERAGLSPGSGSGKPEGDRHRGREAARACLEMITVVGGLREEAK